MSPEVRMPPSAITGTLPAPRAASMIAVSCGTPTPATIRVVQIEPGPIPTLIASAPASTSALAASAVATLPAIDLDRVGQRLDPLDRRGDVGLWPWAVSMTMQSQPASISASERSKPAVADGGRGGDPQPPFAVLGRERRGDRLFDVLDGDQADAMVVVVDHQQFLDPPLVEDLARLGLGRADRHGREIVAGHQLADRLPRIFGEAHVAVGQDAGQLARFLDDRDAADAVGLSSARAPRPASGRGSW